MTAPFRCAAASAERADPLAGTASTVGAFLLLEHAGPWGAEALRDSRLPERVRRGLAERARATGVRVLLVRRPRSRVRRESTVFAAFADPHEPWLERGELERPEDVLDLDLGALAAGRSLGLTAHPDPVLLVCTHGRHDACCAERGRPVAAALAAAYPGETWECSHIGGDRFAANLLVLPQGLYHGRLDVRSAVEVARRHHAGEVALDGFRGRSGYPMPVQAAEIALRHHLGDELGAGSLRLTGRTSTGHLSEELVTVASFTVDGAEYAVEVRTTLSPDLQPLTCKAAQPSHRPRHDVVRIRRLGTIGG